MKEKRITIILTCILVAIVIVIISLLIHIKNKQKFVKPEFDVEAKEGVPLVQSLESNQFVLKEGYTVYVNPTPTLKEDKLLINFTSFSTNNIWIKLRIKNEKGKVIGETGLLKAGEYIEYVSLDKKIKKEDAITYVIMGYEKDTYLSAGTVTLNTKVAK